jgi:2-succinyl-6-hydroxy-2,4-cyclohexadiene-1-carboxylate synthase
LRSRIAYVHGFAGGPHLWRDLPPGTAIALPGHGGGDVQPTWDANLDAIAAQLAERQPGCDAVVGYSLGARVALGLVSTGRVPYAILISVNPGLGDERDRVARRASDAQWAKLLREGGIRAFADAWQAQPLFATQLRAPAERLAERRAHRLALDPEQLARSLEVMGLAEMPDYRGAVTSDRCALVAGANDSKYLAIARDLPARLDVIADCGHDPTLEQPAVLGALIQRLVT